MTAKELGVGLWMGRALNRGAGEIGGGGISSGEWEDIEEGTLNGGVGSLFEREYLLKILLIVLQ